MLAMQIIFAWLPQVHFQSPFLTLMSIEIKKLGTFDPDIVEINPVVFKGKLWLMEYIRNFDKPHHRYYANQTGDSYFRFLSLEDYRTVYPRSRVFRSLALLRQFAEQKYTARRITVNRGGEPPNHGAPRRAIGGNSPRQFEAPPGGFERKPLSKEELDKIVEAENAHEREMIERKTSPRNKTVQQKAAPSGEL